MGFLKLCKKVLILSKMQFCRNNSNGLIGT